MSVLHGTDEVEVAPISHVPPKDGVQLGEVLLITVPSTNGEVQSCALSKSSVVYMCEST